MTAPSRTILPLRGVRPDCPGGYFKGLGILKALSRTHPDSRGRWAEDGWFEIDSAMPDEASAVAYFCERYQPSPFCTAWNKDAGLLRASGGAVGKALKAIEESTHCAFAIANRALRDFRSLIVSLPTGWEDDDASFVHLRSRILEAMLPGFDSVLCLVENAEEGCLIARSAPLFVSGGCDARADFSSAYNQRLAKVLPTTEWKKNQRDQSERWLQEALFGDPSGLPSTGTAGHFFPASSERPNSGQGPSQPSAKTFTSDPHNSPWDLILCVEGLLLFVGAASRRFGSASEPLATFPFAAPSRRGKERDLWLPLWDRFASLPEIVAVLAKGRAKVARRAAYSGTDFARAITGFGVDRGFRSFRRFRIGAPDGKSHISVFEGEFLVAAAPALAQVVDDLDPWLRQRALPKDIRFDVEQAIETAIQRRESAATQAILVSTARAELKMGRRAEMRRLRPVQWLSPAWLPLVDDGTVEFEVAAAIASVLADRAIPPFRSHLVAIEGPAGRLRFSAHRLPECWNGCDVVHDLQEVLHRRYVLSAADSGLPFLSARKASLAAVTTFLHGQIDFQRLATLIPALSLVDWSQPLPSRRPNLAPPRSFPGAAYAALRVLLEPRCVGALSNGQRFPEPIAQLLVGYTDRALASAQRRLQAFGRHPVSIACGGATSSRLAASLLIPVSASDLRWLADRIAPHSR